jgi:FAD/FMN-containing dehydrogenase
VVQVHERGVLDERAMEELTAAVRGTTLAPTAPEYDAARSLWNGMIDRRPAVIVRCTGVADVRAALAFADAHGLTVAVKGGGHNVAGRASADGGLMLDLAPMRWVQVDPASRLARVGPGAVGGDLDHEAQAFGLATTTGTDSTTGVIGLMLGGGMGFLGRRLGLTCDNLVSADVVLADGSLVRASETENPDLYWALRGGGGELGVVVAVELRLHQIGPEVSVAQAFYPMQQAAEALRHFRNFAEAAPPEVMAYALAVNVPPVDPFPAAQHGKTAIALVAAHSGPIEAGSAALEPFADLGEPMLRILAPMPYVALQQSFDASFPSGRRYYWKSSYVEALTDAAIQAFVDRVDPLPGPYSAAFFERMGGAVAGLDVSATAFPHRRAAYNFAATAGWDDAADDDRGMGWARGMYAAMQPYATDELYANYAGVDDLDRRQAIYGPNADRLAAIRSRYDPRGRFRSRG